MEGRLLGDGTCLWLKVLSATESALRLRRSPGFTEVARFSGAFTSRPDTDDPRLSIQLPLAPYTIVSGSLVNVEGQRDQGFAGGSLIPSHRARIGPISSVRAIRVLGCVHKLVMPLGIA